MEDFLLERIRIGKMIFMSMTMMQRRSINLFSRRDDSRLLYVETKIQFSFLKHIKQNIMVMFMYKEDYVFNSRGIQLFTCSWKPDEQQEPKALIFLCHGYAMESSITMSSTAVRLANAGFAVYGMDYEGHGKSGGLDGYVKKFDDLVHDVSSHYSSVCEREENKGKMRFLMGESMGGAVVLLLARKKPDFWDGAVLVAPMCKLAEDIKPHPMVISFLTKLTRFIPTWKIVPANDIIDRAFKESHIRKQVRDNEYCYKGRPRLKTAHQLLMVSLDLEKNLDQVSMPFIVLHGEDDKVTDKNVSKLLYEVSSSSDKTFKLYPKMWHGLLYGESPENLDIVFGDIIRWLNERASVTNQRLENELKHMSDGSSMHK